MGERLVIEIHRDNQQLASLYYHWSAYSRPAINILFDLNERVLSRAHALSDKELQLELIRYAEHFYEYGYVENDEDLNQKQQAMFKDLDFKNEIGQLMKDIFVDLFTTHGGVDAGDLEYIQQLFPNEIFSMENVSRNHGLVSLSKEEMRNASNIAAAVISVDLSTQEVENTSIYWFEEDEYVQESECDEDGYFKSIDKVEQIPIDLVHFKMSEIPIVRDVLSASNEKWMRFNKYVFGVIDG